MLYICVRMTYSPRVLPILTLSALHLDTCSKLGACEPARRNHVAPADA